MKNVTFKDLFNTQQGLAHCHNDFKFETNLGFKLLSTEIKNVI